MREGDPEELANELLTLLTPYGVTATGQGEGGVFMVPLQRLNAIVVFAVERWRLSPRSIAGSLMLDIPPDKGAGRQTFVYSVENAKAADLAAVLNQLFGGGEGQGPGGLGRNPTGQPGGTGLFGAGGTAGRRAASGRGRLRRCRREPAAGRGGSRRRLRGRRGTALGGTSNGLAVAVAVAGSAAAAEASAAAATSSAVAGRLRNHRNGHRRPRRHRRPAGRRTKPEPAWTARCGRRRVAPRWTGAPPGPAGTFQGPLPGFRQEVRIVADDVTNSLVVLATKRDYQLVLDVVRKIDVVPRQVVLEVMIAEVALTKDLQFGIAYAIPERDAEERHPGGDAPAPYLRQPWAAEQVGQSPDRSSWEPRADPRPTGAFAVITNQDNFAIFINALNTITRVKMLSAPHIIAADNREAHILVGSIGAHPHLDLDRRASPAPPVRSPTPFSIATRARS